MTMRLSLSIFRSLRPFMGLLCIGMFLPGLRAAGQETRQVPVDSLIFDLKNPDPVRRKQAAILLGTQRIQRATPDLVAAAGDSDASVRREIVLALDKMRDVRALSAFADLSGDPEKDIRQTCVAGLLNLYLPQESGLTVTFGKVANFLNPWSDEWADVVIDPGLEVDPRAVGAWQRRLQDPEEGIRIQAARALGIVRGRDASPSLIHVLRVRSAARCPVRMVRALRKIGDVSVATEILNYISFSDSRTRNEAVFTIGRFRHRPAVPELTRLYEKESVQPKKNADMNYAAARSKRWCSSRIPGPAGVP